ncbi:uncharacterized protein LOC124406248 [Diprion similis]|uniref:uncharacterized protein LOC124406248 n=1 Tax=Diprion similis TaxID=362088 RepID=UPI001EF88381|nr:uncharacterized protein LOC124406248 [Diprion similis]
MAKLNILKKQQLPQPKIPENWVVNLTGTQIPHDVKQSLAFGPKHGLPCKKHDLSVDEIIASIETAILGKNTMVKDKIRSNVACLINNKMASKNNKKDDLEIKEFKKANEYLKQHNDLIVTKADKGNVTVIMNQNDYTDKSNNVLYDKDTYQTLNKDPTKKIEKQINDTINLWQQKKFIDSQTAKNLKIHNSLPPKIYFQPKIHKTDVPLRPIVSNINAPTYKLSKFCGSILYNIIRNSQYHVKDTWSFVNSIKGKIVPTDHVLISLDIISLFTNVPTKLVMSIITKKWPEIKKYTNINKKEFIEATKLILDSCYFIHNNQFFKQIFGVAMGSPMNPVVANLVLEHLENKIINNFPFKLPFYYRYVDDIITAVRQDQITTLLNKFNSFHPKIQFTYEEEKNNKINFLDTTLINTNNGIILDWFHKDTWSVYRMECKDCHKIYIGQSSQNLKNRISGHRSKIKNHDFDSCALASHSLDSGHNFDFENTTVIATENNCIDYL